MGKRLTMSKVFCAGNRVYLRTVEVGDASVIAGWKRDPLVQRMALGPDVEVSTEEEMKDIERANDDNDQLYLVLVTKRIDHPIGYVRINWLDGSHRFAWLRFALGEQRGKGYAKDGLQALLRYLLTAGVHRVEAEVYEFNRVSLGLLEGLGFEREGVKRHAHFDGESYHDIVVLGLLVEESLASAAPDTQTTIT